MHAVLHVIASNVWVYSMYFILNVCVEMYSQGLCGGDDMGINLGSMKDRKDEEEDEDVCFPVGLLTAWWAQEQKRHLFQTAFYPHNMAFSISNYNSASFQDNQQLSDSLLSLYITL